jgi:LCP family protein required for cell wall assembly
MPRRWAPSGARSLSQMKTTLKRGYGRGAALNGHGNGAVPPPTRPQVTRYRQPEPPPRSGLALIRRILVGTLLLVGLVAGGLAGGGYLYYHQSVASVRAHTPDVKKAAKQLDIPLANHAAIALVVGYDHRKGAESAGPSRSDTMMLVRADPISKTISLLSFPRDLLVPLYCPDKSGAPVAQSSGKINSAYALCGSQGSLATVKQLTGLPINYLITVDFHGFKEVVDTLGGVWMDVDRRYYNKNVGSSATNFADINIRPGYQRLNGNNALEFVRFRHTDSDLTRLARQQEFVKAFKQQVSSSLSAFDLPKLVTSLTHNIEVGSTGANDLGKQILRYALFAYELPNGHFFQTKLENLGQDSYYNVLASQESIQKALQDFQSPDVEASQKATAVALGRKLRSKAPAPKDTSVYVLNGNGVPGAAANAAYALLQRGYRILTSDAQANAPSQDYYKTKVYFARRSKPAMAAAPALANLFAPGDVEPLPPTIVPLVPAGAMLVVVVGSTFHGDIAPAPLDRTPVRQKPSVRYDREAALDSVRERQPKVPYRLLVPTILESSSQLSSSSPARLYYIEQRHKALRLTFVTGASEYWGIEETDWADAPILSKPSATRKLKDGRTYDLYYNGSHLHMAVLRGEGGASYWVVNTLLDSLSNETMIAIAKGLKAPGK